MHPHMEKARTYARPHAMFGNGIYYRVVLELLVDPEQRTTKRRKTGAHWILPEPAVAISKVHFIPNDPPERGEERFDAWDGTMEALPQGKQAPAARHMTPSWEKEACLVWDSHGRSSTHSADNCYRHRHPPGITLGQ